ncbi:flagellin [Skermanella pratensis]|uniref:flagellin n=1 Tax=Skermanella pratensis TaxID=2233999 RepID=UPI001300E52D|nr:flagellin [Skermanella pratensis]
MANSVNTNIGAMVALKNLNSVSESLSSTQKRISTGLNVADAYDDGASYAVAEGIRSDVKAIGAVNERLAVGKGMIDVAVKAGENISKSLQDVRVVLTKLSDEALNATDRANYNAQYTTLKEDIDNFIKDAKYNGVNLIDSTTGQKIISNVDGGNIEVKAKDLKTDVLDKLTAVTDATGAAALIADGAGVDEAMKELGTGMNQLAADSRRVTNQIGFNNAIADATNTGLGAIVDADLAKESARLQSLQVKQQLSSQALSIANQSPQSLLGLFR